MLPRLLSSHTDSADPTDDTATVVDGDDLRSIGGPQADTADDDGLEDSYPEAADEAADELIKARRCGGTKSCLAVSLDSAAPLVRKILSWVPLIRI